MSEQQDFLQSIMGFDPRSLSVFNEREASTGDSIIYKTNPSLSKSEDGHYRATLRVIYNPLTREDSIVKSLRYSCKDEDGFFQVNSALVNNDKNCPMFKAWSKLWYSKTPDGKIDESKREWAKAMFDRAESQWCIVQIINDPNRPELNGQLKIMKIPRTIYNRMAAKLNPSPESGKQPVKLMDYIFGLELDMDVIPGPPDTPYRVSYDSCEFRDTLPIINIDGTPLFTDEEYELIDSYAQHQASLLKAKTDATREKEIAAIKKLEPALCELYIKASEMVKAHAPNLKETCGYKPWTEEETARINRWIQRVLKMENPEVPETQIVTEVFELNPFPQQSIAAGATALPANVILGSDGYGEVDPEADDLPF